MLILLARISRESSWYVSVLGVFMPNSPSHPSHPLPLSSPLENPAFLDIRPCEHEVSFVLCSICQAPRSRAPELIWAKLLEA